MSLLLGIALLFVLYVLIKIRNHLTLLASSRIELLGALHRIEQRLGEDGPLVRELHAQRNPDQDARPDASAIVDWITEKPDEAYRWLHKVPPDACALRCPADFTECWQNYCVRFGECGFWKEHNHLSDDERSDCEVCRFSRHATLRFRDRLRNAEETNQSAIPPHNSLF
jgi:hypothetical protein